MTKIPESPGRLTHDVSLVEYTSYPDPARPAARAGPCGELLGICVGWQGWLVDSIHVVVSDQYHHPRQKVIHGYLKSRATAKAAACLIGVYPTPLKQPPISQLMPFTVSWLCTCQTCQSTMMETTSAFRFAWVLIIREALQNDPGISTPGWSDGRLT